MIQFQLKLILNRTQQKQLDEWFNIGTGIWNWAIRKIELDARDGFYYSQHQFNNILAGHPQKLEIPNPVMQGMLTSAWRAWKECFKKNKGVHPKSWARPRFKGYRKPLTSLPYPDAIKFADRNHVKISKLGSVKFHERMLPDGKVKSGRILKQPSGYYLCIFIDCPPKDIELLPGEYVGIDPGFKDLLNLSTGEKVNTPDALQSVLDKTEVRLKQAMRARDYKLVARLSERVRAVQKQRNHIISTELVRRFDTIVFGVDNESAMAKTRKVKNKSGQKVKRAGFGKSVAKNTHYQLRQMIKYKAEAMNRRYIEIDGKYSTKRCSSCFEHTGPTGLEGLSVREWVCSSCGAEHERDTNAAINVLIDGLEMK